MKEIYFAGGCFWGVEHYFSLVKGVDSVNAGYAQGNYPNPTYEEVCSGKSTATEAVKIVYDETQTSLKQLLPTFFKAIDPTALNRQAGDIGRQYRSGIYFTDESEESIINEFIDSVKDNYRKPIVVEVQKLDNFYLAEEHHQDYLRKNPTGYCHINFNILDDEERK